MEITVNGKTRTLDSMTVQQYLQMIDIDPRRVAVEHNREILPKNAYETTVLRDGDQLEIVHFVGGG